MNDNVIPFGRRDRSAQPPDGSLVIDERVMSEAEAKRFERFESGLFSTEGLDPQFGTPSEWLATALLYLKCQTSGERRGIVRVSMAAIDLIIMRLEELEYGGEPWRGSAA